MYDTDKLRDVITNTTILFGNHHEIRRILESLEVDLDGLREIGPKIIVKPAELMGVKSIQTMKKSKLMLLFVKLWILLEQETPTGQDFYQDS